MQSYALPGQLPGRSVLALLPFGRVFSIYRVNKNTAIFRTGFNGMSESAVMTGEAFEVSGFCIYHFAVVLDRGRMNNTAVQEQNCCQQ